MTDVIYLAGCSGKEPFASRALAQQVAKRRRRKGKRMQFAYKCDICGKHHIGTKDRNRR